MERRVAFAEMCICGFDVVVRSGVLEQEAHLLARLGPHRRTPPGGPEATGVTRSGNDLIVAGAGTAIYVVIRGRRAAVGVSVRRPCSRRVV